MFGGGGAGGEAGAAAGLGGAGVVNGGGGGGGSGRCLPAAPPRPVSKPATVRWSLATPGWRRRSRSRPRSRRARWHLCHRRQPGRQRQLRPGAAGPATGGRSRCRIIDPVANAITELDTNRAGAHLEQRPARPCRHRRKGQRAGWRRDGRPTRRTWVDRRRPPSASDRCAPTLIATPCEVGADWRRRQFHSHRDGCGPSSVARPVRRRSSREPIRNGRLSAH